MNPSSCLPANAGQPICMTCAEAFSEDRPRSMGNHNMCVQCVTGAREMTNLVVITTSPKPAYPNGRWGK